MHYRWTDVPGKWRENYHLLNPSSVQATASTGVMWLNLTLTLWAACSILGQEAFHHGISKLPVHFEWPSIPFPRPQAFRQPKGFLDTPKTITKFLWVLFSFLMFLNPCLRYLQEVQLPSCSVSCSSPSCTSCLWFPYPHSPSYLAMPSSVRNPCTEGLERDGLPLRPVKPGKSVYLLWALISLLVKVINRFHWAYGDYMR